MSRMIGIRKRRAAQRSAPSILAQAVRGHLAEIVRTVEADGKSNMDAMVKRRSGALKRYYRSSVSGGALLVGRVGYLTPRARKNAFYARFLNDGTRDMPARPFHDNAVEDNLDHHVDGMRAALATVVAGMAT